MNFVGCVQNNKLSNEAKNILNSFDVMEYYNPDFIDRAEEIIDLSVVTIRVEIGCIAELIYNMLLYEATEDELIEVIKYSMVVMDCISKRLDYNKAALDFHISEMWDKYVIDKEET